MKKLVQITLIVMLFTACNKKGSIEGDVYFQGNQPDAGAIVTLFSVSTEQDENFEAEVGLDGKYRIEGIPEGHYLMIAQSKNVVGCPDDLIDQITSNPKNFETITGYRLSTDKAFEIVSLKDKFLRAQSVLIKHEGDSYEGEAFDLYDEQIAIRDSLNKIATQIVFSLPDSFRERFNIRTAYPDKIKIRAVEIRKKKTAIQHIDFEKSCL